VIAKISGESYPDFIQRHIFGPLGLSRSWYTRTEQIHPDAARGFSEFMYGLPDEYASLADWSWYDAAGGLTMSAADLARWDIALTSGHVVSPQSFAQMTTPFVLPGGKSTHYGFGLGVGSVFGRPTTGHDGLVSGFSSENLMFPKDRVAIVLLSNGDNFAYLHAIRAIAAVVYGTNDPQATAPFKPIDEPAGEVSAARNELEDLLHGKLDFSRMTPDLVLDLPSYRVAQLKEDGRLLGEPIDFAPSSIDRRPPLTIYRYRVRFRSGLAEYVYSVTDSGQFAGFSLQAWQ
jgi:CubicO group peptidase (beta-lactamase class C family)